VQKETENILGQNNIFLNTINGTKLSG